MDKKENVIEAEIRTANGKSAVKRLRKLSRIPGVCYGAGDKAFLFSVDKRGFSSLLRHSSENTIITLAIGDKKQKVLIRELQIDRLANEITHIDLSFVSMTKKVDVEVTIELEGTPQGVQEGDGVLEHTLRSIHVRCLPNDIPDKITIDVTTLGMGDSLSVGDIAVDTAIVEVLSDTKISIASVVRAISEEELKVQIEEDGTQPEVIDEKPPEEEAADNENKGDKAPQASS